jgi:hypothetical protein
MGVLTGFLFVMIVSMPPPADTHRTNRALERSLSAATQSGFTVRSATIAPNGCIVLRFASRPASGKTSDRLEEPAGCAHP